jgi:DNA-binding protein YbaB
MLQDLIQAAFNQALREVDQALAEKLGGMAGLPGGLKIPGLT